MAQINQYPTKEQIDGSELLVCFDVSNSDTRKFSVSALSTYIAGNISANMSGYVSQYSAPALNGLSISITEASKDTHLILTPTTSLNSMTLVLPLASTANDGQRLLFNSTQAITTLTIGNNGATSVIGAPTTISANAFFTLKYDKVTSTWYRVG